MLGKVFGYGFNTPIHESINLIGGIGLVRIKNWDRHYYFDIDEAGLFTPISSNPHFEDQLKTLYKIKECVERIKHDW